MTVQLNHTIVPARDARASADFLAGILGLVAGSQWGPFIPLQVGNGVTLDYIDSDEGSYEVHHYAFLVSDEEFEAIFERIRTGGVAYYANPGHRGVGEINHHFGGRGVYFDDPNGHVMEAITRPYGGSPDG